VIKFILNNYEVDLIGDEDFVVTYECSNEFKFNSNNSVEITIPETAKNLKAVERNNVMVNDSKLPYNFIPCQISINGIDMKMEQAVLLSISGGINLRLFGGNITLFSDVKDKSIQDLDLSTYDHTRNWAYMSSHRNTTTGILYPIIDYGFLSTLSDDIEIANLYPSIYYHNVVSEIISEAGYTLAGDLQTDEDYLKLLLPFSNKNSYVDPAVVTSYLFEAALEDNIASNVYGAISLVTLKYFREISDPANRFDGIYYYPAVTGSYTFHLIHRIQLPTVGTQVGLAIHRIRAGVDTVLQVFSISDYTNLFTITWEMDLNTNAFNLKKGDKIYIDLAVDNDATTNTETTFELISIDNTSVGYDEFWEVAPNLPNIKQGELLKYIFHAFGCIVQCDDSNKIITVTKLSTVKDNTLNGQGLDWSDLLDRSGDEISFTQDFAQVNHLTYQDEENVIKPVGTDYDLLLNNKSLPPEKDLYTAPFGASEVTQVFTFFQNVWRVDINGASGVKPRVLVSNYITLDGTYHYTYNGSNQSTDTDGNVPYFIDLGFNLGFENGLRYGKMKDSLELLVNPKQLKCKLRLKPIHINQLNFSLPIWIDYYKSWFYISKINQFKYNSSDSTVVNLIKL